MRREGNQCGFGYAGLFHHEPTGLDLATYRIYDAGLGRFISRDPIGYEAGLNLYAYTGGNPINLVDPTGLKVRIDPTLPPWVRRKLQANINRVKSTRVGRMILDSLDYDTRLVLITADKLPNDWGLSLCESGSTFSLYEGTDHQQDAQSIIFIDLSGRPKGAPTVEATLAEELAHTFHHLNAPQDLATRLFVGGMALYENYAQEEILRPILNELEYSDELINQTILTWPGYLK